MKDFTEWYARTPKNFPASLNNLSSLLRQAYEAGAASQSETLRDKFAGQVIGGVIAKFNGPAATAEDVARSAYGFADAMLEARKVKGEET
jgi:hypothetical protein